MTRSVEIPEEALELAHAAYWSGSVTVGSIEAMRAALEAALPYLAPAGDGGLREALAELADKFDDGRLLNVAGRALRQTLAAHPAAPAVPQPVDREALARLAEKWSEHSEPAPRYSYPEANAEAGGIEIGYMRAAEELAAVLAGEQEQVEK